MNCPKCNSNKTHTTGIVFYSCPLQIEYECDSCRSKFNIVEGDGIKELSILESAKKHPYWYLRQYDLPCCFRCDNYNVSKKELYHCKVLNIGCLPIDVCGFFKSEKKPMSRDMLKSLYNDAIDSWLDKFTTELKEL